MVFNNYDHWLSYDTFKDLKNIINKCVDLTYNDLRFQEPALVNNLLNNIKNEEKQINSVLPNEFELTIAIKDIFPQSQRNVGCDIAIIIDIITSKRKVSKIAIIEAKKCSENDYDDSIKDNRILRQVKDMNANYPERCGYLLFFMPSHFNNTVNLKHKQYTYSPKIQVMPVLDYLSFRGFPTLGDILSSSKEFVDFLINGLIGTPEGSRNALKLGEGKDTFEKLDNSSLIKNDGSIIPLKNYPIFYLKITDNNEEEIFNHQNKKK